jgi:plasmid maintenance system killer protein
MGGYQDTKVFKKWGLFKSMVNGQWSVRRINDQWRLCFASALSEEGDALNVEIVNYH